MRSQLALGKDGLEFWKQYNRSWQKIIDSEGHLVFVFGSNTQGRHGKGMALIAKLYWGAIQGQAKGLQGKSYAIVTKNLNLPLAQRMRSIPLYVISMQVDSFLVHAMTHQDTTFLVAPIGCGLAGYTPEEIAPMFNLLPPNVILPDVFLNILKPAS